MTESATNDSAALSLYRALIDAWNRRDAKAMASVLADGARMIGFDGSTMHGPAEVEATLAGIFAHHPTPAYIAIVRDVTSLSHDVEILSAVVGMAPAGQSEVNPKLNAIQTLVAAHSPAGWRVSLFQTTPAAFHGRPELVEKLTEELKTARSRLGGAGVLFERVG